MSISLMVICLMIGVYSKVETSSCKVQSAFQLKGDIKIGLLLNDCNYNKNSVFGNDNNTSDDKHIDDKHIDDKHSDDKHINKEQTNKKETDHKKNVTKRSANDFETTALENTLVNSAIWTVQRLNYLEATPFKIGLQVFQTCSDKESYNAIFELFRRNFNRDNQDDRDSLEDFESYLLGVISLKVPSEKFRNLCQVLNIKCRVKTDYFNDLVQASVSLLDALNWSSNVTVVYGDDYILDEFNSLTRIKGICVQKSIFMKKDNLKKNFNSNINSKYNSKFMKGHTVIFGNQHQIQEFLHIFPTDVESSNGNFSSGLIFIPTDGLPIKDLPEGSFVIHPQYLEDSQKYTLGSKIVPSPLLFELANPIINLVSNVSRLSSMNCRGSNFTEKLECFMENYPKFHSFDKIQTPFEILSFLKIETLLNQFTYNIFKVEIVKNKTSSIFLQNLIKMATYNIFDQTLSIIIEPLENISNISINSMNSINSINSMNSMNSSISSTNNCTLFPTEDCFLNCLNYEFPSPPSPPPENFIRLRSEAWVYAYLAISALGCIFCIAIIIFFLVRICKNDIFEGNPTLTILLLLLVILMYASILPFSITGGPQFKSAICITRSLSSSLIYAASFSLLLSRCIILATISKDVSFMAHASGPVQLFLGTFMFGVQIALSFQLIDNCFHDRHVYDNLIFSQCYLCILSYNMILLFLLICTTFFIMKSERNYREGKYFAIAIFLIACVWCVWVPVYWLYRDWEDEILCFGLVGTASALLGSIFIPRTYVMTISVARDKFTSVLPALASATSAIDIYRASTQPIYDCINIAAINANSATIRASNLQHPDLYSCPNLPDEFTTPKCDTPVNSDKLTRF